MGNALSREAARPVLWSFRRCPYAIRARLAIASAGQAVTLREVVLRDKPDAFLVASQTATVPCLEIGGGVIDESLDIMLWALCRNDPQGRLNMPPEGRDLIAECDGAFKRALDRYKYASRHRDADPLEERARASTYLRELETRLTRTGWLFGSAPTLADMAILPFVRQFAHVDFEWFEGQPWSAVSGWLARFKASTEFASVMTKYPVWVEGQAPILFP